MSETARIDFLINSMEGGGAERAMANLIALLLPHLSPGGARLVLLDDLPRVQTLPDDLPVATLDGQGWHWRSAVALDRYWSAHGAPAVCLSFLARANCLNVALKLRHGHQAIISERVNTTSHLAGSRGRAIHAAVTRLLYPRAETVVAVSDGVADDLAQGYGLPRDRLRVIGNPIDAAALRAHAEAPVDIDLPERFILAVGRLVPNKNFALLIDAHARLGADAPPLVILGDGPERAALATQAQELGLGGRVQLKGFVPNPYPVMARAAALGAPSRAEGFPNTLIEAMTLGCPAVATDCPSGPRDVIGTAPQSRAPFDAAPGGILVPMEDAGALAGALETVLGAPDPAALSGAARATVARFDTDGVVSAYLDLLRPPPDR